MSDDKLETIQDLKDQIVDLKIRLRRVEEFLLSLPTPDEYIIRADPNMDEMSDIVAQAAKLVREFNTASASFLQRKLNIGYARAARIIDELEERGIVAHADGSKPRKVYKEEVQV
jgi:S-DNA-T family DNA segregation ATPase FtsK/SpoIIIE